MGSKYSPEGLYDPEYFILDNGMGVVLKKRDVTHNVSIRLVVNVGMNDFPCGAQELPHFLEHLLFTGTSKHTESELENLIKEHGGSWNAFTMSEKTIYDIDIYSPNALFALDILYEIITDSQITPENVELTRDIIHREMGGKPSAVTKWLYRHGIFRDAFTNAELGLFPNSNLICPNLETAEGITRKEIMDIYKKYYVPNNMALIIVGEFEEDALVRKIKTSFGALEPKPLRKDRSNVPANFDEGPSEFTGTLSPLVDSDGAVGIIIKTDGFLSPDYYTLSVIENYLNTRIYEKLRIDRGLSYTARAAQVSQTQYGTFYVTCDTDFSDMDLALRLLRDEVDDLKNAKFNVTDITKAKQKILLSSAQGLETNSDIAGYYSSSLHELTIFGALIDEEDRIERITEADVRDVAARYFKDQRIALIKSRPLLTYTQFYILVGCLFLMAVFISWRVIRKLRKHLR